MKPAISGPRQAAQIPLRFESSLKNGDQNRKKVKQGNNDNGKAHLVDPAVAQISILPVGGLDKMLKTTNRVLFRCDSVQHRSFCLVATDVTLAGIQVMDRTLLSFMLSFSSLSRWKTPLPGIPRFCNTHRLLDRRRTAAPSRYPASPFHSARFYRL